MKKNRREVKGRRGRRGKQWEERRVSDEGKMIRRNEGRRRTKESK